MSSFRVRESAENDLFEIGLESREKWGDAQIERYIGLLVRAFHLLADMPELGKACDDIRPGWRRLPEGSHVIFYRIAEDGVVDIIRVLHSRMDPELHLDQEDD